MERSVQTMQLLMDSLLRQSLDAVWDDGIPDRPGVNVIIPLQPGGIEVRTDMNYVPCGELFDALQLYTIAASSLEDRDLRELNKAVGLWNRSIFLGSLELREDRRALYHRYSLVLPRALSAEQCALIAERVLASIMKYLTPLQQDIISLLSGVTFEQLQADHRSQ